MYIQGQIDHTLFTKFSSYLIFFVVIVYLGDIGFIENNTIKMKIVKHKLFFRLWNQELRILVMLSCYGGFLIEERNCGFKKQIHYWSIEKKHEL